MLRTEIEKFLMHRNIVHSSRSLPSIHHQLFCPFPDVVISHHKRVDRKIAYHHFRLLLFPATEPDSLIFTIIFKPYRRSRSLFLSPFTFSLGWVYFSELVCTLLQARWIFNSASYYNRRIGGGLSAIVSKIESLGVLRVLFTILLTCAYYSKSFPVCFDVLERCIVKHYEQSRNSKNIPSVFLNRLRLRCAIW